MESLQQEKTSRLRLSIQLDQVSSPVGGGRFIRGFVRALLSDSEILNCFEHVYLIATQNESVATFGPLPANVTLVNRRFPGRLRQSMLGKLFGRAFLPAVDVAYGSFYHVFPSRTRARVITAHDLSCFNLHYHSPAKARSLTDLLTKMVQECDGIVLSSKDALADFRRLWPQHSNKATAIYCGVSPNETRPSQMQPARENSILAVGTVEPRKNYPTLLDAFDRLIRDQGSKAPHLVVIGNKGWMSEVVVHRLEALEAEGRCQWMRNATDDQLAEAYSKAGVFTYLSLSEGFGYPPFEAAFAHCPMVLSAASSVGEIWSRHAKCVDPLDVDGIVAGWKWALGLSSEAREELVASQEVWAREFTWTRTLRDYLAFWTRLVDKAEVHTRTE